MDVSTRSVAVSPAGGERRGGEAEILPERIVPRHDRQHHAERLEGDDALAGIGGDGLVGKIGRRMLGVEIAVIGAFLDLGLGFRDGLAHLAHDHFGIARLAGAQRRGHAGKQPHALTDRHAPPGALGLRGRLQRGVDGGIVLQVEAADRLSGGGVDGGDRGHEETFSERSRFQPGRKAVLADVAAEGMYSKPMAPA